MHYMARVVPNFFTQTLKLFEKNLVVALRQFNTHCLDLVMLLVCGFIVGFVISPWNIAFVPFNCWCVIVLSSLGSGVASVKEFGWEKLVFWREASAGLNISAYFWSHTLMSGVLCVLVRI